MSFSIVILTHNEVGNISACLDSVAWCDDVVVLDSGSSDGTVEVVRERGIKLVEHPFENFGAQRNFANDSIDFQHDWLFHLDADERFTDELRDACDVVMHADEHSAYFVPNRMFFLDRWIKRSSLYPYPQVRFLKLGEFRYEAAGHGQREAEYTRGLGSIEEPYDHYNFSKGIADWVQRHNRYSTLEADALVGQRDSTDGQAAKSEAPANVQQMRGMKRRLGASPFRAIGKVFYLYIWKRGFLDGVPGLFYCGLQGFYEFLIASKVAELQSERRKGDDEG